MIDPTKPMTDQTAGDLRALIDALQGNRERYDRANRIVEARSCELEIAEATRALAIHNRRATEAEDQRAAEERVLLQSAGERVAELEAIIETMKAEVWEANEDNFLCGQIAAEQGCLVANKPSDAVRTLANRYAEARAQREADLREAYVTGAEWMSNRTELADGGAGIHISEPSTQEIDQAAAEYARSKAGG